MSKPEDRNPSPEMPSLQPQLEPFQTLTNQKQPTHHPFQTVASSPFSVPKSQTKQEKKGEELEEGGSDQQEIDPFQKIHKPNNRYFTQPQEQQGEQNCQVFAIQVKAPQLKANDIKKTRSIIIDEGVHIYEEEMFELEEFTINGSLMGSLTYIESGQKKDADDEIPFMEENNAEQVKKGQGGCQKQEAKTEQQIQNEQNGLPAHLFTTPPFSSSKSPKKTIFQSD